MTFAEITEFWMHKSFPSKYSVSRLVVQIFRQTTDLISHNFQNQFSLDRGNQFQIDHLCLNPQGMDY